MDFQIIAAIVFIAFLTIFLYVKRKNLEVQKILFPILYFMLYRTKLGLKFMKSTAKKHPRFWQVFSVGGVIVGFMGMALIVVELFRSLWKMFVQPEAPAGVAPVLPVPVQGAIYVPFFYWIACIFIIAMVHEFSHGIVARLHGIRIKSSGFAFLGVGLPIIPAAFVEPDETQLQKKKAMKQLGVFAAGPFSNIILGILSLILIMTVINPISANAIDNTGVLIQTITNESPAYDADIQMDDLIIGVDDTEISTIPEFTNYISEKSPGETITIKTNRTDATLTLGENPTNTNKGYIGITFIQDSKIKESFVEKYGEFTPKLLGWIYEFFFWLYLLNIGIGLFNLVPLGPVDGGRMVKVALLSFLKEEDANRIWKTVSYIFLGIILYMLFFPYIRPLLPF
jgi:membrane-associated protease RseP (regulator of RpoE activity)